MEEVVQGSGALTSSVAAVGVARTVLGVSCTGAERNDPPESVLTAATAGPQRSPGQNISCDDSK